MSVLGWITVTVVVVLVGFYLWGGHLNKHPEKLAPIRTAREEFAVERERAEFAARLVRLDAEAERRQDAAVLEATRQAYADALGHLGDSLVHSVDRAPVAASVSNDDAASWWAQAAGR